MEGGTAPLSTAVYRAAVNMVQNYSGMDVDVNGANDGNISEIASCFRAFDISEAYPSDLSLFLCFTLLLLK